MSLSRDSTNLPLAEVAHLRTLIAQLQQERAARLGQAAPALEAEVSRTQQAEAALRASEQQYQLLYNDNPSMYFTLSQEGAVLSVNRFGADQLGYRPEALIGQSVLKIFRPEDHQTVLGQLLVCASSPSQVFQWDMQKIRQDGTLVRVRERARAIHDQDGRVLILVVCEDITVHNQIEVSLRESERAIRALQEATSAPGTFEQRIQTVLELGCRRFKLPIGAFTKVLDDQLEIGQIWPATAPLTAGMRVPLCQTYCSAALETDGPLSFEHAGASEWRHHPGYAALGIESYLGTKLSGQHKVHGTIVFFGPDPYPGAFSDADKDFLLLMARWISGELDRQEAEQRLGKINECFLKFGGDPLANINRLTALCGELLVATCALYSRLEGEMLSSIGQWQAPSDFIPVDQADGHLCCDLIRRGEDDVSTVRHLADTSYADTDPNVSRYRLQTYIGKVVKCGNEAVGSLCVVFQRDVVPTEADERLMSILASAIGTEEERLRAQKALQVSEERFAIAFRSSPHPVIMTELATGRCLDMNDASLTLFGYRREEVIDRTTIALGLWPTPEDRAAFVQQLQAAGAIRNREIALRSKDRTVRRLLVSSEAIELNGMRCLVTVGHDITEQKEAEASLRDSEARWRAVFEHAGVGIAQIGLEGRFLRVNARLCETLGYSSKTLLQRTFQELTHQDDLAGNLAVLSELTAGTRPSCSMEQRYQRSDGTWLWANLTVSLVRAASSAPAYFIAVVEDISERKRAEEALRMSEVQWYRFVADAPVGMVIVDARHRLLKANKAFCALTGYDEQEVIGDSIALYTHPDDLASNMKLMDECFTGTRAGYSSEKRYIRKSGEIIWVSVRSTKMALPGHADPLLLAVVENITERKQATEERDQLSQDLHDDVLQSLYAIGMGLEMTRQQVKPRSRTAAKRLEGSVKQLNNVIREVRNFIPRVQTPAVLPATFDQALRSLVESLTVNGIGKIALDVDDAVAKTLTPTQCTHLLSIAREALSNSLRHGHAGHRSVTFRRSRGHITLTVSDDGVGFRPAAQPSSGMGLRNMQARARKMSATLAITSRHGKGTQVRVSLPSLPSSHRSRSNRTFRRPRKPR